MRAQSFLIKPASSACNMRCRYCFYADITDLRDVKSYGVMSLQTLERIVKNAFSEVTEIVSFGFQGGEPTLVGLDFYRALTDLVAGYNKNHIKVAYALQTNGMLIDDEWAAFLSKHGFLIGLSVDGEKQVHDMLRHDMAGKGTHGRCMAAARTLARNNAEFNILSVVTRQLAAHPERAWRFYRREGLRFLQFIPCLDGLEEEHGSNPHSLDAKAYGDFLCRIFDLWYVDFRAGDYISVRSFDNYIHMLAGRPPENCAMAGRCSAYPLIEADGSVYPCDFYAVDEYRLGNVNENSFTEMLSGAAAERFREPSGQIHPDCAVCEFVRICRGGCRREREPLFGGAPPKNHYCEAYKCFFNHTLERMRQIAGAAPGYVRRFGTLC